MTRKLNTYVHVAERDADGNPGRAGTFGPGDVLPDWAIAAITNPDVWEDDESGPDADALADEEAVDTGQPKEPPRGGPGSSAAAWAEFAEAMDLEIPDGASAKEIQALWDERR